MLRAVKELAKSQCIAIDLEFERRTTYFPITALIQVYDGVHSYVIDPICIDDLTPLKSILTDESIEKWVHSGFEDIECLFHLLDCQVASLWDSQIAASFLINESSIGYGKLVESELGIQLPKEMTRSDWLQRPLCDLQMQYAVADVYYLWKIVQRWKETYQDNKWWQAIRQESELLADTSRHRVDPLRDVADMRGIGGMHDQQELELVVALVTWRDQQVRQMNKPKKYAATDSNILDIVKRKVTQLDDLKKLKDMHPASIRRFGGQVIDIILKQGAEPGKEPAVIPKFIQGIPKNPKLGLCMSIAKEKAAEIAKQESVAEGVLLNRKLLHAWVKYKLGWYEELPPIWQPWRQELLLPTLEKVWLNYQKK